MIRTILAVVLTVALVATAVPAVRHGSAVAADEAVRGEIATLEAAATALVEDEELPPEGVSGPRRVLALALPRETATSVGLASLEIERAGRTSVVTYRLAGRSPTTVRIDAPVVAADGGPVALEGGGDVRIALELADDGDGLAVVARPGV